MRSLHRAFLVLPEDFRFLLRLFLALAAFLQRVVDTVLDGEGRHGHIGEILAEAVAAEDDLRLVAVFPILRLDLTLGSFCCGGRRRCKRIRK